MAIFHQQNNLGLAAMVISGTFSLVGKLQHYKHYKFVNTSLNNGCYLPEKKVIVHDNYIHVHVLLLYAILKTFTIITHTCTWHIAHAHRAVNLRCISAPQQHLVYSLPNWSKALGDISHRMLDIYRKAEEVGRNEE